MADFSMADLDPTTDAPPSLWPQPDPSYANGSGLLAASMGPGGGKGSPVIPMQPSVVPSSPFAASSAGIQAPDAPNIDPMVDAHQSFLHRLSQGFLHAAKHVGATIGGNLVPNSQLTNPDGTPYYSDADMAQARRQALIGLGMGMASARPGFSTLPGAFAQGVGESQQAGQQTLTGIQNQRQQSLQMAQYQRVLQARQQIAQKYAVEKGDGPKEILAKAEGAGAELTAAGDYEGAKAYAALAENVKEKFPPLPRNDIPLDPGQTAFNSATGKADYTAPGTPKWMVERGDQLAHQQTEDLANLSGKFDEQTADYQKREHAYSLLQGALASKNPQLIVDYYSRLLSPGRVNTSIADGLQAVGGMRQRLENWLNGGANGEDIQATISDIANSANRIIGRGRDDFNNDREHFVKRGVTYGIPESRVRGALTEAQVRLPGDSGYSAGASAPPLAGGAVNPFPK